MVEFLNGDQGSNPCLCQKKSIVCFKEEKEITLFG